MSLYQAQAECLSSAGTARDVPKSIHTSDHDPVILSAATRLCAVLSVPVQIHHQLFGLPCIELEVIPLAPVHKVLNKFSVGSVVLDEADSVLNYKHNSPA